MIVKTTILAVLCVLISLSAVAADNGYNVKYDGGSVSSVKAGNGVRLFIEGNQIRVPSSPRNINFPGSGSLRCSSPQASLTANSKVICGRME
jgi:hypothetical protein